tara:strand:- start:2052 stop:2777 length:726 start_codon:yes stop_codon:yes gene_type:complete
MANGQKAFAAALSAGKSSGEYESSKNLFQDIYGDIDFERQSSAIRGEQRETAIDTALSVAELGSTLWGGYKDKQEFKLDTSRVEKMLGEDGSPLQSVEVGSKGKLWKDLNPVEKAFQTKQYRFGEGDSSYTLGKEDVTLSAGISKYGGDSSMLEKFKTPTLLDEATNSDNFNIAGTLTKGLRKVLGMGKEDDLGSTLENPFKTTETGQAFRMAKERGFDIGSTIYGEVDGKQKSWLYEYAK